MGEHRVLGRRVVGPHAEHGLRLIPGTRPAQSQSCGRLQLQVQKGGAILRIGHQVLPPQVHLRDVRKHFAPAPALLPLFQGLIVRRLDLGRRRLTHQVGHHALHQGAQFQLVQI